MNPYDIITVIRDPRNVLGKQFSFDADGQVVKNSSVAVSLGVATQHHIPNVLAMEKLLEQVSEDSHAAIINAAFPLIPVGVQFLILSEKEFKKFGIQRFDPAVEWPVTLDYGGKELPALGRFKEHTAPSTWVLLDRDIDEHTPQRYAELSYEEWLGEVDKLLPGLLRCARLRAHSASARVSHEGKPVGGGNGHTWIQLANPNDLNRLPSAIKARALDLGMAWTKPRRSRTTGEVVGQGIASIIDWSVLTTGRLVFVGKPETQNAI